MKDDKMSPFRVEATCSLLITGSCADSRQGQVIFFFIPWPICTTFFPPTYFSYIFLHYSFIKFLTCLILIFFSFQISNLSILLYLSYFHSLILAYKIYSLCFLKYFNQISIDCPYLCHFFECYFF